METARTSGLGGVVAWVLAVWVLAAVFLSGMLLAAVPAGASEPKGCTHSEVYIIVFGDRIDAPTNDECLGPSGWEDSFEVERSAGVQGVVVVGVGIWISEPF